MQCESVLNFLLSEGQSCEPRFSKTWVGMETIAGIGQGQKLRHKNVYECVLFIKDLFFG